MGSGSGAKLGIIGCPGSDGLVEAYVYLIRGRVQDVGFRAFTEREAEKLSVRGHVRNLADGRVEVLAQGDEFALGELESRLREGPRSAKVDGVDREEVPVDSSLSSFRVRY